MPKYTEEKALQRLTSLCAAAEYCSCDILEKMSRWELDEHEQARIMAYLIKEKYVDDERFCRAYIESKIRFNQWGRRKIEQGLYRKRIPRTVSNPLFSEIDSEQWMAVLVPLLDEKRRTVKARNDFELRCKLINFALQRGFEMNLIEEALKRQS